MKHYILLDRSGSMYERWQESISALKEYANGIDESDTIVLKTFDTSTQMRNHAIVNGPLGTASTMAYEQSNAIETISSSSAKDFSGIPESVQPRGMTPLYDAVGSTLMEAADERAVIIVITDGFENSSRRYSHSDVRKLMEAKKEVGVEVIFIGADFNNMTDAAVMGVDLGTRATSMKTGQYASTMTELSYQTRSYASSGDVTAINTSTIGSNNADS